MKNTIQYITRKCKQYIQNNYYKTKVRNINIKNICADLTVFTINMCILNYSY